MKLILFAITMLVLLGTAVAPAQNADQVADHQALRKLKNDVVAAINTKNFKAIDTLMHKPFLSTVITQDSFNEAGPLITWFESLFTRNFLRLSKVQMDADADELAQIYTGTLAVARGTTKERYELADGRGFDMQGRWTATAIKQEGQWKVLAVHTGTNFLDNPVMNAIERNMLYFAGGGAGAGAIVGILCGFFIGRRRRAKAA
jgi:ketosteroid isomerase-like protein